jgi:hypothetical protein
MNYKQITMGIALSLLIGSATADCLSSIKPEKDGVITWSDLARYDACLKADNVGAARKPLTLEQDTWAAACSGGSFTNNQCFGGDPATNSYTKLVLQVTNIYAIANLSLTATYPARSIWIRKFTAGLYANRTTGSDVSVSSGTQAVCGAFTEVGWGLPSGGLNVSSSTASSNK